MVFENIFFTKINAVATIKFNRPKLSNSFNFDLGNDFVKALEICMEDNDTRAVIITGEGKAFCAGGDLDLFKKSPDVSDTLRHLIKTLNMSINAIREMPKPVIAAINGAIGGAGMSIAAACDLAICVSSAKFKQGYTSVGLVPDGGWTLMVPLLIGFRKATELVLLDPVIDAQQALELGLVNKVVEDTELDKEVNMIALKIAQGPAKAFAIAKKNINKAMFGLLENHLELERQGMIIAGRTSDAKEGIAAFIEKRKPCFTGT